MHGQCEELLLPYLSEAGVAAYLAQRFGESSSRRRRCGTPAYQRHPLFLVTVVEEMLRQGRLRRPVTGGEHLVHNAAAASWTYPSLRRLIDQQLEQSILKSEPVSKRPVWQDGSFRERPWPPGPRTAWKRWRPGMRH